MTVIKNSYNALQTLEVDGKQYRYFDLNIAAQKLNINIGALPISIKILFENLLRFEDGVSVTIQDLEAIAKWPAPQSLKREIAYRPARVLMQDFTGVPAIADLAAMRDYIASKKGNVDKINPLIPTHLVIDHSVQVHSYATTDSLHDNVKIEMEQNIERYLFLKWGQQAFENFKVVPPGTGICHQVNLEYLAKVVWSNEEYVYPDTVIGTDSHTTMINGLGVLGWGVGGIEAEAAMLGQPVSMLLPEVVGCHLYGDLDPRVTATDLVLILTNLFRKKGVVNKFVEFYGNGLDRISLADRATIANMAPEYGATCGFFPIDDETLKYLRLSGREADIVSLVEAYSKKQGLWRDDNRNIHYTDILEFDLSTVVPSLAGPRRPQDKVNLDQVAENFKNELTTMNKNPSNSNQSFVIPGMDCQIKNGDVVIAAITSCTNTSNPQVMLGAALLAKKAVEYGLTTKKWVKTSIAPGSQVVSQYLEDSGLMTFLEKLGFYLVGYGCTTCIGNSGPLLPEIEKTIIENKLVVAAVLSGNRNFEGRIHPLVQANYLASPPLCVAYALAGTMNIDFNKDAIGISKDGKEIYLKDIWPTPSEVKKYIDQFVRSAIFKEKYAQVYDGEMEWQKIETSKGQNYQWDDKSTYIKQPPFFNTNIQKKREDIKDAAILAVFGDSITTDHISPAGSIIKTTPAAQYLISKGIEPRDFNSYGARRGNHEIMMRGTFANTRIKNELVPGVEGGFTTIGKQQMTIYDAAMQYASMNTPLVIIAGKEYGTGSSRDWAAKGTKLLGITAVIAESFERIHRSNLVGIGVIPLVFKPGHNRHDLKITGIETINIIGLENLSPFKEVECQIIRDGKIIVSLPLICRIDTIIEVEYLKHGGILQYVADNMLK